MAEPSLNGTIHGLTSELMGHVLSFLPVPVLCRMRTVCKTWNHIISSSSFHDSDEQTSDHGVCFLTRFDYSNRIYRPMRGTTCFLDINEKRWYLIKDSEEVDQEFDVRNVVISNGLVAEFGFNHGAIQISDAILKKKRWRIDPCPCEVSRLPSSLPSLKVMAGSSRMFRIFLFDRSGFGKTRFHQCLWIYESSTNKWRSGSQPPRKGSCNNFARSAVIQQGLLLYAIFTPCMQELSLGRFLAVYDIEKDTWSMVLENLPVAQVAELVVSSGKLFMTLWRSELEAGVNKVCGPLDNELVPTGQRTIDTRPSSSGAMMLEMVEIQVLEKTSRIVLQIPASTLSQYFVGEKFDKYNFRITCLALRLNSDSSCSSMVLFSNLSGKVIIYNVASATAEILPQHPLGDTKLVDRNYWATYERLCFRDILRKDAQSHPPVNVPKEQLLR